ncbi:penicillin-binding transpeptidase domain-containing protein [Nocardioides marmoraquaticus]
MLTMRPGHRTVPLVLLLLLGSACSAPWSSDDEVQAAAETAAAALSSGETERVRFAGDEPAARAAYDAVVTGLPGDPSVEVRDVEVGGEAGDGAATATLAWSWDLGVETWRYTSEGVLEQAGDEWRLRWQPALVAPGLGDDERLVATRVGAVRGDVLGADDARIVEPRPVVRVGVDRGAVPRRVAVAAAREVAALVDVDPAPYVAQVRAAGERAFVEAIVYRAADLDESTRDALAAVRGARLLTDSLPLAPTRDFAAALLGSVGPATAEVVEDSDGRVAAGDEVGLSGLQRRYDERLAGRPGVTVDAVPSDGEPRELFAVDAVAGEPLRTTLDLALQERAQRVLADVGPASGLVALRPSTGEVLAAASGPGSDGYSTATFGQYAPGSTFKVVTSLALLREGLGPDSLVSCPATVTVDGREFENYDDYPGSGLGDITLRDAVARSCNTAFIGAADRLGPDALASAAASLGLGVDHDLGFPAFLGEVPRAESGTGAAAATIGQGTVLASPLAMAAVTASVVAGEAVLPRLLPDVDVEQEQPRTPLTGAEAQALRTMMGAVVTEGSGSLLADLAPPAVLAKTGTAEFGDDQPPRTHAWMVGAQGDLAVAVFVEEGESGSSTAGPLLRAFLEG